MKVRGSFSIMPLLMRAPAPEFILQCNKQHLGGVMQVTPLLQSGQKASLRQLSQAKNTCACVRSAMQRGYE